MGLSVGRADVDRLLSELSAGQYREWLAFAAREPFGPASWDARIGFCLSALINALTGARTRPADFVPQWGEKPAQTPDEMRALLTAWGNKVNAYHRKD